MEAALITTDGSRANADDASLRQLLEARTPFWLDIFGAGDDPSHLLRDVFGFHPLAVEDADHFGQRPKVDDYDDYVLVVMYGTSGSTRGALLEVHCFYSERYLVTVHHEHCSDLNRLFERLKQTGRGQHAPIMLLHKVLDTLVDSFFPALAEF